MLYEFCEDVFFLALRHDLHYRGTRQLVDMSVTAHDLHKAAVLPKRLTFFQYLCALAGISRQFTAIQPPQVTNR